MNLTVWGPYIAFCSSITWAIGSTGYAKVARRHSAYTLNFTRALVGFPLFVIVLFFSAHGFEGIAREISEMGWHPVLWLLISMIASYAIGDILFLYGTRALGVPGTLAIASAYPLWNAAIGFFFEGEKLHAPQIAGLIFALIGIGVVILNGPDRGQNSTLRDSKFSVRTGVFLAVGASLFWALNSYAVAKAGRECSASLANSIRMVFGMALTFSMSRALGNRIKRSDEKPWLPWSELKVSLWFIVLEAFAGSYFFLYGLAHSRLAIGSVLTSLAPVISVPVAWMLGIEKASLIRSLGIFTVVVGLCLLVGT